MKEILYIPTGQYFRFFREDIEQSTSEFPAWSAEEFVNHRKTVDPNDSCYNEDSRSLSQVIKNIIAKRYSSCLYDNAGIAWREHDLLRSEFAIAENTSVRL